MRANLGQNIEIEEMPGEVKLKGLVLDKSDSSLSRAHRLSVLGQLDGTDLETPVLWLDGGNSFDPYPISEISEGLGLDPERSLQGIYISRAFTCYQMKSLILEELDNVVEELKSDFIVITGLSGAFSESDLFGKEALRVFEPVEEKLGKFRKSDRTIFLTSTIVGGKGKNEFVSRLETVSNRVLGPEDSGSGLAKNSSGNVPRSRGRKSDSGFGVKTLPLEEFA